MSNLVTVVSGEVTVSSRHISENFGKELSKVHRSIEGIKETIDVATFGKMFKSSSYEDSYGRTQTEYTMNRDGFSLLSMGFTGSKAMQWKLKYIQAFNEMEAELLKPALPDFNNPAEAARAWASAWEAKQIAEAEVKVLAPKGDYYDELVERRHLTNFRDTANELKIGQKEFMTFLESKGYIYRHGKSKKPKPYMKYVGKFFELKEFSGTITSTQCLITVLGKETFRKQLKAAS